MFRGQACKTLGNPSPVRCVGMHETVRCMVYPVANLMILYVKCVCLAVAASYTSCRQHWVEAYCDSGLGRPKSGNGSCNFTCCRIALQHQHCMISHHHRHPGAGQLSGTASAAAAALPSAMPCRERCLSCSLAQSAAPWQAAPRCGGSCAAAAPATGLTLLATTGVQLQG